MDYQRILVFGAHPDDELTMAATMAKLASEGVEVHIAIMTDGREGYPDPSLKDKIVELRRQEQAACDEVLGTTKRHHLGAPDQELTNSKENFLATIGIIREVRPDAIFTHGPIEKHRDHLATHELTIEARWQGGEPVNTSLGEPHVTPHLYYYKNAQPGLPAMRVDVTDHWAARCRAYATQKTQMSVFRKSVEEFLAEAAAHEATPKPVHDTFWIAPDNRLSGLLPKGL